jgi:glucose-6-phosphate 1-epimerase
MTFGQLPAVRIASSDGACAIVTLFGAQLVSWTTADGVEQLFCSHRSSLDGSRAIRGGVPIIFPQFNERGPIIRHGFARLSTWTLLDSGAGFAVFALGPNALSEQWPHAFALRLRVALHGAQLTMTLEVENTGATPFAFSAALHTYHRVADVAAVRIDGVQDAALAIGERLDAIYRAVSDVRIRDGARTVQSSQSGFTDAVVWNPGDVAMADMAPGEYRQFVCVEPAVIAPVTLAAGAHWRGHNTLKIAEF